MSASDFKPGIANSSLLPVSQLTTPLDVTTKRDDLDPQALELLYEFFHLLDQWDQPEER